MAWERIQRWGRVAWERIKRWGRVIFYQQPIRASKARGYGVELHHSHILYRQLFVLWLIFYGGQILPLLYLVRERLGLLESCDKTPVRALLPHAV